MLSIRKTPIEGTSHSHPFLGDLNDVIRQNQKIINGVARRFRWAISQQGVTLDDMVSEATLGMIKAYHRFDPGKNARFTTYAFPFMLGEIRKFIRSSGQPFRVSDKLYYLTGRIIRSGLEQKKASFVAQQLGCSETDAFQALRYFRDSKPVSMDKPMGSDEDGQLLSDLLPAPVDGTESDVALFIESLDEHERQLLRIRQGSMAPATVTELLKCSSDELDALICQLQHKAQSFFEYVPREEPEKVEELSKERYLEMKKKNHSDEKIAEMHGIGKSKIYTLKQKWGLTGVGMGKSAVKKSNPKSVNDGDRTKQSQPPTPAAVTEDWKSRYDNLSVQFAERGSADAARIARLEQEVDLLKGMLKFYL